MKFINFSIGENARGDRSQTHTHTHSEMGVAESLRVVLQQALGELYSLSLSLQRGCG